MIAEFYIRTVDKVDPKTAPNLYRKHFQAGDVIAIQPSGWCWGDKEISSPEHIIVKVDVVSIEQAVHDYMSPELLDPISNPSPNRRAVKVGLSDSKVPKSFTDAIKNKDSVAIATEYQSKKMDGKPVVFTDADSVYKIPDLTSFDLTSVKVLKPLPVNPFTIGQDPFVVK